MRFCDIPPQNQMQVSKDHDHVYAKATRSGFNGKPVQFLQTVRQKIKDKGSRLPW